MARGLGTLDSLVSRLWTRETGTKTDKNPSPRSHPAVSFGFVSRLYSVARMNTMLDRDRKSLPTPGNLCEAVRSREAAAYYGENGTVDLYGYSHLSNAAEDGGQDVLVLMHPRHHADDGLLARVVPQEVPETHTRVPKIQSNNDPIRSQHQPSSTSAISNLRAAIEAVLGSTPTLPAEVEAVREERFAANGAGKFRGVTRHKRTLRFEAHIWESKKQIYLVRAGMRALAHSHARNLTPLLLARLPGWIRV